MKANFSQQGILERVAFSYLSALRSQFQPRMLLAILLPVVVGLAAFVLIYILFFGALKTNFAHWLETQAAVQNTDLWLQNAAAHSEWVATMMGWLSLKSFFATVLAMGVVLPFIAVLVLAVMAFALMPIVVAHLRSRDYPDLVRAGRHAGVFSMVNALKVILVFCVGWLVTLPLWLIPPLAVLLPIFWWGYAFKGFLSADAIATHANSLERRLIFQRYRWDYWLLGLSMALLSLVPFFWIILPVFSALVFAHFTLRALSSLRTEYTPQEGTASTSEAAQGQDKQALSYDPTNPSA
ncbi:MAG TPA: EI24 domain-containing protein [Paenalcaligenes sp.]|nr:EI24 domain-containing protein [Paenalcaligenes sp.]